MFSGTDIDALLHDAITAGDAGPLDAGFQRMWGQAWAYITDPKTPAERADRGLSPADPEDVTFLAVTGMRKADFEKKHPIRPFDASDYVDSLNRQLDAFRTLSQRERAKRLVDALQTVYPELKISATAVDPVKVSATELVNVRKIAEAADAIFTTIASGSEDESIGQVFGTKNVAKAKRKYAAAHKLMDKLVKAGEIVTDPSGYSTEEGTGGKTVVGGPIQLNPINIANPEASASITLLIHESLHAANGDIVDRGYVGSPDFLTAKEEVKLANAAHFEVVPFRILAKERNVTIGAAYEGQIFTPPAPAGGAKPAGAAAGSATKLASDTLESAWNVAMLLHRSYLMVFNDPDLWDFKYKGVSYSDYLPFWSKVEKLTIHERLGQINPAAAKLRPARAPVNAIDIAISEEVVRDLGNAMQAVPKDEHEVGDLVAAARLSDTDMKDRMSTPDKQRDLIIELVCGQAIGGITGTGARDLRAVLALAETRKDLAKIEKKRTPSDFAD